MLPNKAAFLAASLLLFLLAGCTLSSRLPLIEQSERVAGFPDARYRLHVGLLPEDAVKLTRAQRARCLDPGYYAEGSDAPGATAQRVRIVYCDRDAGAGKDAPVVAIRWTGDAYAADGPEKPSTMRLRSDAGLMLLQMQRAGPDASGYDYWFAKMRTPGFELFLLDCDNFPSIARPHDYAGQVCEIESFDQVRDELDRYAAAVREGRKPPLAILTPVR